MKATGIVRRIDELGRIVIPMEMRKKMDIKSDDPVEIFVEGDRIILEKYVPTCIFCGSDNKVSEYKNKKVCAACLSQLQKL